MIALFAVCAGFVVSADQSPVATQPSGRRVVAPPDSLELDSFYRKYVDADGLMIVASQNVSDHALLEAAWIVDRMLANRPDVRKALAKNKVRLVVMAYNEMTTQVPEHRDLKPSRYWDRRARGLGATPQRPAVSCGEENLLCYPGDPYAAENILVHEFAHAIHHMALDAIDKEFDARLDAVFKEAMKEELWKGKYAASNRAEYWAEGVQSWFGTNRPPDHDHNHVDTRKELEEYDPRLAKLIADVFGSNNWQYKRPDNRPQDERTHLKGFDRRKAPEFRWDPALQKWYDQYQKRKS